MLTTIIILSLINFLVILAIIAGASMYVEDTKKFKIELEELKRDIKYLKKDVNSIAISINSERGAGNKIELQNTPIKYPIQNKLDLEHIKKFSKKAQEASKHKYIPGSESYIDNEKL